MENWKTVLARERSKESHLRYMIIFTVVVVLIGSGILYIYTVNPVMAEDYCITLLNSHDSEISSVPLTAYTVDGRDIKYGESVNADIQTKKVVNVLSLDGSAVDCQLSIISSSPQSISSSYNYRCNQGTFSFETRDTFQYYFVAYQLRY